MATKSKKTSKIVKSAAKAQVKRELAQPIVTRASKKLANANKTAAKAQAAVKASLTAVKAGGRDKGPAPKPAAVDRVPDEAIPAFLDRSKNGIKPAQGKAPVVGKTTMPLQGKAALAAIQGEPKGKAKAPDREVRGADDKANAAHYEATKSAEKLMALLGRGKAAAAKAVEVNGKVVQGGKVVAQIGPAPGTQLTVKTCRVGMRVRVMGLEKAGKVSASVYTILPFDPDEPKPGAEWFAIDDDRCIHVGDLIAA